MRQCHLSSVPLVPRACTDGSHGQAVADGTIVLWELLGSDVICGSVYETYRCPRCGSTASRRLAETARAA